MFDHCPSRAVAAAAAAAATESGNVPGLRALRVLRSLLIGSATLYASLALAAGLVILSPQPGQNLRDNGGQVTVALALEDKAEVPRGFAFRILLDGQPAAPDVPVKPVKSIPLTGVHRGTHELQALIIDGDGQVRARSPAVTFTLHQASRRNPP